MSNRDDSDSDEPITLDDIRSMWMQLCLWIGLLGLLLFAVHFAIAPEDYSSLHSDTKPWGLGVIPDSVGAWIMFVLIFIFWGSFLFMGAMNFYEYWKSMRYTDVFGLALAIFGIAIIIWNFLFTQVFPESGIEAKSPTISILLTSAGCFFLYGKTSAK